MCVCVCVCLGCDFFYFTISLLWKIHDKVNIVCVRACVFVFGIVLEAVKRFSLYSSSRNNNKKREQAHTTQFPNARAFYIRIKWEYCYYTFYSLPLPVPAPFSLLHFQSRFTPKHQVCILLVGLTDLETVVVAFAFCMYKMEFYRFNPFYFPSKKCTIKNR